MKTDRNFSTILTDHSILYPNKIYCQKINGRGLSFLELENYVNKCCHFLEELGLKPGDILTINIPNSLSSIVLYIAAIRSGLKMNPSPSSLSENELILHIKYIETKVLISKHHISQKNLHSNFSSVAFTNDDDFLLQIESYSTDKINRDISPDDIVCIYYSSGTTGNSKYVLYSHKNMISLIDSIVHDFKFSENTKHLGVLPLGHTAITNYQFLPSLYAGSSIFLAENFNSVRASIWKIIEEHDIDYLQVVPTVLFAMLATPYDESDYKSNKTLKYVGCGSAPLSVESQNEFFERFNVKVANLYGLSETGPSHFDNPLLPGWRPGNIGRPLTVNSCKIFDKDMKELEAGEVGQIGLKGDNVFVGYYKNDAAYKSSFFNDFFLTGDLGYEDNEGKFYFSDREKDLIIKGGVNIVPGEIEEVIFKLKEVQSAAVVGLPHSYYGEDIIAFVQKKQASLTEQQVIDILAENLQPLKRPSKIIFIKEMPIGPSGKILKRKLRDELNDK
jgi:long-chain acyl-CoA synthetase